MRVKCRNNSFDGARQSLTIGAEYAVLGIEAGDYRILDDSGRPYLFPADLFDVIDADRPSDWIVEQHDGVEYAYPPELNRPGFFEDLHDRDPDATRAFAMYLNKRLGSAA